jgi:predicted CXXCH cytochrome family protein
MTVRSKLCAADGAADGGGEVSGAAACPRARIGRNLRASAGLVSRLRVPLPAPGAAARRAHLPARLALVVIAAGLAAAPAFAQTQDLAQLQKQKGLRPAQKTCIECHGKELEAYKARASSHAPVREGKCEACHLRHGVVGVLRLAAADPALCLGCHAPAGQAESAQGAPGKAAAGKPAGAAAKPMTFNHPPGDRLKCGACHDPHGSGKLHLLKAEGSAACLSCHEAARFQGPSAHKPATADCLTCHDPHGGGGPRSLRRPAEALCASCHDGGSDAEKRGHGGGKPAGSTCLACHTPHASQAAGLLKQRVHAPMAEVPGGCATCHVSEGEGARKFALNAAVPDICVTCHDDPRKTASATGGTPAAGKPAATGAPGASGGKASAAAGAAAAAKGGGARVHPPVGAGDCLTCHTPHASDEKGLLKQPQAILCGNCHSEAQAALSAKAPHPPAVKECTACHLPHAGPVNLLKAVPPALCETCHADIKTQVVRAHPHPPAAAGACLTCHNPHGSANKRILKDGPAALCVSCHAAFKDEMAARFTHPPAAAGECASCHEPHGSDSEHLLAADLGKACLGCHKSVAAEFPEDSQHAPFASGECLSCHRPHASSREHLLATEPSLLCRSCHAEVSGEKAAVVRHTPVQRGQCLSCHGPHGGHPPAFLRRADSRTLCLACHEAEGKMMVRKDLTLHPPFQKGPCLACHAPHASDQEGMLVKAPGALCTSCHDISAQAIKVAHKGLLTAHTDCTSCHEPHASDSKTLTLPVQHPPFSDGDCGACHSGGGK